MKTWLTYSAGAILGLITALLLRNAEQAPGVFYILSNVANNIGLLIFIPMLFITFASGVASLRRDRLSAKVAARSLLWAICLSLLLPLVSCLFAGVAPEAFPATSTSGAMPLDDSFLAKLFQGGFSALFSQNAFYTLATTSDFILPVVLIALFFGLALKPSSDVIKPAYVTMNSFAEVMYKIARYCALWGSLMVYCNSSFSFIQLFQEETAVFTGRFALSLVIMTLILALIIIPFIYACFTKFKKNPYAVLLRSLSPVIMAAFSGNINSAAPVMESAARHNLGVQKRVASTSIPLYLIISRGGAAAVSVFSTLALIYSATGALPSASAMLSISLISTAASFVCSVSTGFEPVFISLCALRLSGISLYGAEMNMIAMLPLLSMAALLLDAEAAMLGCDVTARFVGAAAVTSYKEDTI